jgi:uncharacterized protein DUF998
MGRMVRVRKFRWLLLAGFVPLPWFLIWAGIGGLLSPGYSALSQQVSELTLKPGLPHLIVNIGALGCGAGFCLFSVGLWRATQKAISFGAVAWLIFGVSILSNGIWPMGGPMHGLYGVGMISLLAPTLSLIELRVLRDSSTAYFITVFVSLSTCLYLWLNFTGFDPAHAKGLTQRIFSSINSLWPAVIATILLRQNSDLNHDTYGFSFGR